MKQINFRTLTPEDVECRVCNTTEKSINLLLYKNARVDMAILNDTVGLGWKREHNFKDGKNYCTVSIYDEESNQWISREDCGVESNTEAEKGQSSDAFKRACFNFGIGVELYSTPKISIPKTDKDVYNGKVCMTFNVKEMTVDESKKITHLVIVDKWGNERFRWDKGVTTQPAQFKAVIPQNKAEETNIPNSNQDILKDYCSKKKMEFGIDIEDLKRFYKYYSEMTDKWKGTMAPDILYKKWMQTSRKTA